MKILIKIYLNTITYIILKSIVVSGHEILLSMIEFLSNVWILDSVGKRIGNGIVVEEIFLLWL